MGGGAGSPDGAGGVAGMADAAVDRALGGAGGQADGGGGQGGSDASLPTEDVGQPDLDGGGVSLADAEPGEAGTLDAEGIDQAGVGPEAGAIDGAADDVPVATDGSTADAAAPGLVAHAGPDRTICAGSSIQIGASATGGTPGYTYAWSASPTCTGCIDDTAVAQPVVSPAATTTFTVDVTDSASAQASDAVTVTVVDGTAPTAEAGPDVSSDPGAAVRIGSAAVAGNTYAWTCDRPACAISDASSARPTVRPTLSTRYTVTVASSEGCMQTDSMVVWVNLPLASFPEDGETSYPVNADLLVRFGAPVLPSSLDTGAVTLVEASTGTPVTFSQTYDAASRTLRVVPTGANYDATIADYTLTLAGGAAGIVSDDPLWPQLLPADQTVDFSVSAADTAAPTIVFRSPAQGATNIVTNTAIVLGFSEALDASTLTASHVYLTTAAGTVPAALAYDPASDTVTLTPSASLAASTLHTVHVTGVADPAGNAMSATTWSYTTGSGRDISAPTVIAVTPANAATGVTAGSAVVVTFSEMIDQSSLASAFTLARGTVPIAGSIAYNASIRQATFTPAAFLAGSAAHTVNVSGVRDLAGNPMAAAFASTFTTAGTLFVDDFEDGTAQWTLDAPWDLTAETFRSSSHSLTDSPAGAYAVDSNLAATSIAFEVGTATSATVRFWLRGRTQDKQDYLYLEYNCDGTGWNTLPTAYTGTMGWGQRSQAIALPSGTTTLQIRFRLTSNHTGQYDGVYIDDVVVQSP